MRRSRIHRHVDDAVTGGLLIRHTQRLRKFTDGVSICNIVKHQGGVDSGHDVAVDLFWPLDGVWCIQLERIQVQLEERYHVRGGIKVDANAGRGRYRRARQAQNSLHKGGLADAHGANNGDVVTLHGGGLLRLGDAVTVSMGAVSKQNVSSMQPR